MGPKNVQKSYAVVILSAHLFVRLLKVKTK
jgi:hypothetical protein